MVDEQPKFPRPSRTRIQPRLDQNGFHWIVPEETSLNPKDYSQQVNVWWSREGRKRVLTSAPTKKLGWKTDQSETLIIRQENGINIGADVIIITLGQAYDLIDALTQAVEKP